MRATASRPSSRLCAPRLRTPRVVRAVCFAPDGQNGQKAKVKFELILKTAFGESVALVGTFTKRPWDATEPLRLEWSDGNVWTAEAELPAGELLEYKYLVTNAATGSVTWQPGSNMELTLNDQSVKVLDSWLGQQHEVQLIPAEQTADAPADEAAPPDAAAKNDTEPAAEPSAEAPAVVQAAAPVTSTSITEAEDASCPPAAPAPNEEPSQPQPDAEDVAGSKPPEVAVGQAASSTQALPKPAAAAKPPPKRPAVPVRKPYPADKPWKSAVPAVAAAPTAGAATAPAAAHRGQPTPAAAAGSIKAEAHSAKEKAPSAAMPVVAAVVCFAIMAAAVAAGAPLLAAALSQLRLAAASVLRFLASLWRS